MKKGSKQSEEAKIKIGLGNKGKTVSEEAKIKMSLASKGKPKSESHRKKISMNMLGRHHTEETKKKISEHYVGMLGKHHTEETKEKLRISNVGKKQSQETIKKRVIKLRGQKRSEEMCKHMNQDKLGKHLSPEHYQKLKDAGFFTTKSGKDHWNWRGGITYNPYSVDWTKTLKRSIRERDKYVCQLCGKHQDDTTFAVHHIDYNKLNCNPNNLITLCFLCHSKTNGNREYWTNYFNNK